MKVVTLMSTMLAPKVAKELNVECITFGYEPFGDGEGKYILHRNLKNEKICYIQSFYPKQFESVLRTRLAIDLLKQRGASYITVIIPYLAFQRQDKPLVYESRNAEVVLDILGGSGVDDFGIEELLTVDPHSEIVLNKYPFFSGSLDPSDCMANYLRERGFDSPLIVAPDDNENAERKMVNIATALDSPCEGLHKHRDRKSGKLHFEKSSINTHGVKMAVIVDDVIGSGDTLKGAAEILGRSGVDEIYAVVTHALVSEKAEVKIKKSGIKEIISTDSIENKKFSRISLTPLIAKLFKN